MRSGYADVVSTPGGEVALATPRLALWANEEITRRAGRGGAHGRVAREFYRQTHFNGAQDDYRNSLFWEGGRARTARERLTDWLMHEAELLRHAKWVAEQNPDAPAEALSVWFDQLLFGTAVLVLPRELRSGVQVTADQMARSSLCKADWNQIAKAVTEAPMDAVPLA